jgi:hypothetical protein
MRAARALHAPPPAPRTTGPLVLRIGGGSTDLLKTIPDWRVWDTLRQLHNESGVWRGLAGSTAPGSGPQRELHS